MLLLGLPISLVALLGIWLGLGKRLIRYFVIFPALLFLSYRLESSGGQFDLQSFYWMVTFSCSIVAVVAIPLLVARTWKGAEFSIPAHDRDPAIEVFQFSILQMLILTTITAALIVVAEWVMPYIESDNALSSIWLLLIKLGSAIGLSSLVVSWAILGQQPLHRMPVSILVLGVACWFSFRIDPSSVAGWLYVQLTIYVWLVVLILSWLMRREGFRLFFPKYESGAKERKTGFDQDSALDQQIVRDPLA